MKPPDPQEEELRAFSVVAAFWCFVLTQIVTGLCRQIARLLGWAD